MSNAFMIFTGFARRRPVRFLMIALTSFFCFVCFFGLLNARIAIDGARTAFRRECGSADAVIEFDDVAREDFDEAISRAEGVGRYSVFYTYVTRGTCADGKTRTVRLLGTEKDSLLNPVFSGYDGGSGKFALSAGYRDFFGDMNVSRIVLDGGRQIEVSGVCYFPQYSDVYIDGYNVAAGGDVADVFGDIEEIRSLGSDGAVNGAYVDLREGTGLEDVVEELSRSRAVYVRSAAMLDTLPSYFSGEMLYRQVSRVCIMFPVLFFAVGLVFICFFLSGTASRARKSFSVLLADGASVTSVLGGVFLSASVPVLAGLAAGAAVSRTLTKFVAETTCRNAGIPAAEAPFSGGVLLLGIFLCLAACFAGSAICLLSTGRKTVLGYKKKHSGAGFSAVVDITLLFFCSLLAAFLILTSFAFGDSLRKVKNELFYERINCDAEIIYNDFVPASDVSSLYGYDGVEKVEPLLFCGAEMSFNGKTVHVTCAGIPEDSEAFSFSSENGESLRPEENRMIISSGTASVLGAKVGDTVLLNVTFGDHAVEIRCAVSAISEQYSTFTEVFSLGTALPYIDPTDYMNAAAVTLREGADPSELISCAESIGTVYTVRLRSADVEHFDAKFSGVKTLTALVAAEGVILTAFFFAVTGYGMWKKNAGKNSILILLGENPLLLSLRDMAKCFAGAVPGTAAGVILGVSAERRILGFISTRTVEFPLEISARTAVLCPALILLFASLTVIAYTAATVRRCKRIV